ncbi:MAG: arsinothricin resistance N-acetyltransferase ArsN1 [Firmicutes bacterium]|nr:arsinothricin resistance N-acetyltransferase ArsN1 [Bacillota bacterium]
MAAHLSQPLLWARRAGCGDVGAITRIYNQGIEDRLATLETRAYTPAEMAARLEGRDGRHPLIVAVRDGAVEGWASLNPFSPREAYRHVADLSVYVGREHRGRGVGTFLLNDLAGRARRLGYHKLVLTAFPFNAAAMALYARAGFRTVGVLHEQGMLDGRWVDTVMMERLL